MTRRLSRALVMTEGDSSWQISCAKCSKVLGPAGSGWKSYAAITETPMQGAGGVAFTGGAQVLLRRFSCPSCGGLLDTETALPEDPFLEDIVHPEAG